MSTDKTDQAALMGAATVGILALVLGEGPWDRTAIIFGLILLTVLFAYYRPPESGGKFDQGSKALAFAATASLLGFITVAYPYQEIVVRSLLDRNDVIRTCKDHYLTLTPPEGKTPDWATDNCLGYVTTLHAWGICLALFVALLFVWGIWVRKLRRPVGTQGPDGAGVVPDGQTGEQSSGDTHAALQMENETEEKWYRKRGGIALLLALLPPVGLYLMRKLIGAHVHRT
jgi:hypothetical protein